MWVDYNRDMVFGPEELILSADNKKSDVIAGFVVPPVVSGDTRMRVSMSRGSAPSACGDIESGEAEDYLISLTGTLVDGGKSGVISGDMREQLLVYPNPGSEIVNIQYTGELENAGLSIYNIQGSGIMSMNVVSNNTELDISGFSPGIYFLVFRTGEKVIYEKLIRQ